VERPGGRFEGALFVREPAARREEAHDLARTAT
jgi:hypothetical protein